MRIRWWIETAVVLMALGRREVGVSQLRPPPKGIPRRPAALRRPGAADGDRPATADMARRACSPPRSCAGPPGLGPDACQPTAHDEPRPDRARRQPLPGLHLAGLRDLVDQRAPALRPAPR